MFGHENFVVPQLKLYTELSIHELNHAHVIGLYRTDGQLRARHGRKADERTNLQVVWADRVPAAPQTWRPFDGQAVGADAADLCAEGVEHAAKALDVRFARSVADDGHAFGAHRRHDDVLGTRDRRFIKENVRTVQCVRPDFENIRNIDRGAKSLKAQEVCVQAAAPNDVPSWGRQTNIAETREQRTSK